MISIIIQELSKSYGHAPVFKNINLTHNTGVLGIAGPNGSGKSTLLKCIGGLLQPNGGQITWEIDGKQMSGTALQAHLGFAAPYISLYKELSVRENLEFLAKLRNSLFNLHDLTKLLALVGIDHVQNQLFGNLSTGQQQRARLASSLFYDPSVLLLDEPGSNLDKKGRNLIQDLAQNFRTAGKCMVIATNDDEELNLCDRIYSIELGKFM